MISLITPSSNLLNQQSEIRISKSETIFKIRNIKHKTETRREVVLDIRFFGHSILFRISDFVLRIYNLAPLREICEVRLRLCRNCCYLPFYLGCAFAVPSVKLRNSIFLAPLGGVKTNS